MAANDTTETIKSSATTGFLMTLILCLILLVIFFALYSYLREKVLKIYNPRTLLLKEEFSLGKFASRFYSWILPAFRVSDDDIFAKAGLDAVVYLRFLRLCLKITVIMIPYGIIVLIPINTQGGNNLTDTLSMISMSNIKKNSAKLWAPWIAVWVYSLIIYYLMHLEWKAYIKYRQMHLSKGLGKQYALILFNIPKEFNNDEALKAHLDSLIPDKVYAVRTVRDLSCWDKMVVKHDMLVMNWEHAKAVAEKDNKEKNVAKVTNLEGKIQDLQQQMEKEQKADDNLKDAALVFFTSLSARTAAFQTVWSEQPFTFEARDMPDRGEVVWNNLSIPVYKKYIRKWIARIIVFAIILFWAIPIAFIATLANLNAIAEKLTFLKPLAESGAFITGFIQSILPVALLAIFKILLPIFMRLLAKLDGQISESTIDLQACKDLVIFDFVNTFFIFVLSGSIFQNLTNIANDPMSIPTLLANSLPNQANFFLNLVTFAAFLGNGMELSRIVPCIIYQIKRKFLTKTNREKYMSWKPVNPPYMKLFTTGILTFLISVSYSVLSPLIVPFAAIYFLFGYVVWFNQLMRVYIPAYQHEGRFWPIAFSRMMVAVFIFQVLMIGIFSLKGSYIAVALLAPVAVITICVWVYMASNYARISRTMALRDPAQSDNVEDSFLKELADSYIRNSHLPTAEETTGDRFESGIYGASEGVSGFELSQSHSDAKKGNEDVDHDVTSETATLSHLNAAVPIHARGIPMQQEKPVASAMV